MARDSQDWMLCIGLLSGVGLQDNISMVKFHPFPYLKHWLGDHMKHGLCFMLPCVS